MIPCLYVVVLLQNANSETCNKLNKLEQQMKQLREEMQEKDSQIMKLEADLAAVKVSVIMLNYIK